MSSKILDGTRPPDRTTLRAPRARCDTDSAPAVLSSIYSLFPPDMRATVDWQLGSIFDRTCDLLVIPSSTGGTVTPEMYEEIQKAGLPFPHAMSWGDVVVYESGNPRYKAVAYAAAVFEATSSLAIVNRIGRGLGLLATNHGFERIEAPVFDAPSGELSPPEAALALARGFLETAPESATLMINVREKTMMPAVTTSLLYGSVPSLSNSVLRAERTRVFISYSHADAWWLERLQKHLKPLQREGVEVWDDTRLKAGEQWREEIRQALTATKVAILLISADFMASDFIDKNELPPLLQAAEEDGATILPVIINHCRFVRTPSLSRFQAVNDPAKPLAQMSPANREKVLNDVASAVEDALNR